MSAPAQSILIAADHAGVELKQLLQKLLSHLKWEDLGTMTTSPVDYPDYAKKLAEKAVKENRLGVIICGSGIGVAIAANKVAGARATVVENPVMARYAREHNHVNILCLGARFVAPQYAAEIVKAWLEATPTTEQRHLNRIEKLC